MPEDTAVDIQIERASEKLRQERETFNQAKHHDNLWFYVKVALISASILIMFGVLWVSSYVVFNPTLFPEISVILATLGLLGDIVVSCSMVWKFAMNPESISKLKPITR
jgi:hypothetical protein